MLVSSDALISVHTARPVPSDKSMSFGSALSTTLAASCVASPRAEYRVPL